MEEDLDFAGAGEPGPDSMQEDDEISYAPQKEGEEKDLSKDGGVKKLLVKAGEGWDMPETGDEVSGKDRLVVHVLTPLGRTRPLENPVR